MPASRPFLWDLLIRSIRFLYLLWGGMLLGTMSAFNRWRPPVGLWRWPGLYLFLLGPWGRGMGLGLGIVMAIAALLEAWELVDRLLGHFVRDHER